MSYVCAYCDDEFSDNVMCPECVTAERAAHLATRQELSLALADVQTKALELHRTQAQLDTVSDLLDRTEAERDEARAEIEKWAALNRNNDTVAQQRERHLLSQLVGLRAEVEALRAEKALWEARQWGATLRALAVPHEGAGE